MRARFGAKTNRRFRIQFGQIPHVGTDQEFPACQKLVRFRWRVQLGAASGSKLERERYVGSRQQFAVASIGKKSVIVHFDVFRLEMRRLMARAATNVELDAFADTGRMIDRLDRVEQE